MKMKCSSLVKSNHSSEALSIAMCTAEISIIIKIKNEFIIKVVLFHSCHNQIKFQQACENWDPQIQT